MGVEKGTNLQALFYVHQLESSMNPILSGFMDVSSYGRTQSLTLFSALLKSMNSKHLGFSHIYLHPQAIWTYLMRIKVTFINQKKTRVLGALSGTRSRGQHIFSIILHQKLFSYKIGFI